MKVVFSGEGGDESFAGYGRYRTGAVERFLKNIAFPGTGGFRSRGISAVVRRDSFWATS